MNENKIGGLFLFLGSVIILITIVFEYRAGWIGTDRVNEEIPGFIYNNWDKLKLIWGWQAISHLLITVSYILLLKNSKGFVSLIWAFLLLFGIIIVISMGITIGSYYPALSVYEVKPELFNSIRGIIKALYFPGQLGSMLLIVVFLKETLRQNGVVNKYQGLAILSFVFISILIGITTSISVKVTGAAWFIIPLMLGFSYWKYRQV